MRKRTVLNITIALFAIGILCAVFLPPIIKVKQKAHVVQQRAAFRQICQDIEDYNEPPVHISNPELNYDPNSFGNPAKILFFKDSFRCDIVTYGDGRLVMINSKGELFRQWYRSLSDEHETIYKKYTDSKLSVDSKDVD
jgi:hypothetical protein